MTGIAAAALCAIASGLPVMADAAELLVLEREGCAWCARFEAEIAPAYPNTGQGAAAPLRRIDIAGPWPADLASIRPDAFTPTFILVEGGVEIDRMRGYGGPDFFWFLLDEMISRLQQPVTGQADPRT